eukprot:6046980-Amphidinium_carterae.1
MEQKHYVHEYSLNQTIQNYTTTGVLLETDKTKRNTTTTYDNACGINESQSCWNGITDNGEKFKKKT